MSHNVQKLGRLAAKRKWTFRAGLLVAGLVVGLVLAEVLLFALRLPKFYKPHSSPRQFRFLSILDDGSVRYINVPSTRIRFIYDGNPHGYFGSQNEIDHVTNSFGFRGDEFRLQMNADGVTTQKPAGTIRLVFLGDSFTFGEGVRFEDTYPELTATLLGKAVGSQNPRRVFESYNFGVGGYNTSQSLDLLRYLALDARPDVVVLGYVLNDAEPPLFEFNSLTGQVERVPRRIEDGIGDPLPPNSLIYRLRFPRLTWKFFANREQTQQVVSYYRSLYDEANPGWDESRRSLKRIIELCQSRAIPCCIVLFPVLHQLNDDYPFRQIHMQIKAQVDGTGALLIDLLGALEGFNASELWVHPSDHHPNKRVHAIAARELSDKLITTNVLKISPEVQTAQPKR